MATIDHAVRLRPGDSSDLDAVMTVMTEAFGDRFESRLQLRFGFAHVAERDTGERL